MGALQAIASWSAGKDSCLACYKALQQGYQVSTLLNFISRESRRGCFHGLESGVMRAQAEAIGIPLVQEETTADMQRYEEEFKAAVRRLMQSGAETMVFGDIYLEEHESWVERVCSEIGIKALEPLWRREPQEVVEEFIDAGFRAVIVSCKADLMGQEFLGATVDRALVKELKRKGICPCGEKGEFHTLVVDGPLFQKRLVILEARPVLKEGFWKHWFLDIQKYTLTPVGQAILNNSNDGSSFFW